MKRAFMGIALLALSACFAGAQQSATPVRGTGTVNEMSDSPDQNQLLTGTRPLAGQPGSEGLVPDNTDRVNGRAYPMASQTAPAASSNKAEIAGNPGGMDQNSGAPMNDQQAVQAAKKPAAPNNSDEANPPAARRKNQLPSPGAEAATRPETGGQTNETKKSREKKK